jgi:uncharacterized protein (TIGR03083 family)
LTASSDVRLSFMAAALTLTDYTQALATAAHALRAEAAAAGLAAEVPTCPGWHVRDLVAHIGGVHRWAAEIVSSAHPRNLPEDEIAGIMAAPRDGELLDWFADGAAALGTVLTNAPAELTALSFLKAAPAPREFWARRQAHETTIHRVDALAAAHGRLVTAAEADVDHDLALDGIDELLTGFITRRSSALRSDLPLTVAVSPSDSSRGWTVSVSTEPPVTADAADPEADVLITGTAAGIFLGLWNRGDEIAVDGEPEFLGVWRDKVRITWR